MTNFNINPIRNLHPGCGYVPHFSVALEISSVTFVRIWHCFGVCLICNACKATGVLPVEFHVTESHSFE